MRGTIDALSALRPDYISVTCSAGGSGNARTPQIAQMVKNCGVEPLAHLTCLHASRADVDAALNELQRLGFENILAPARRPHRGRGGEPRLRARVRPRRPYPRARRL